MSKDRVQHRHVDSVDHTGDDKPDTFQRVEVITGIGRRRRFSQATKARIVRESRAPGAVISEVARRHGLTPQQLFGWRRQLRQAMSAAAPAFGGGRDSADKRLHACRSGRRSSFCYSEPRSNRSVRSPGYRKDAGRDHDW